MKLPQILRRGPEAPSLRERAATFRAAVTKITGSDRSGEPGPTRRAVVAGTLAAAVPVAAVAAGPVAADHPHPDAELLAAGQRYERALQVEATTGAAYDAAWEPVQAVLRTCPPDLIVRWPDRQLILGGMSWPTAVGGFLRFIPTDDDVVTEGWTGEVLRSAIRLAVPRLGRGGQTPHHVRRWRGLLPIADAFDALAREAEAETDIQPKRKAYLAAQKGVREAAKALRGFTASTPEGLAFVARIAALDHARGYNFSPNLLDSTARVAGVDLAAVARPRPGTCD